jgi:hypothetical protein
VKGEFVGIEGVGNGILIGKGLADEYIKECINVHDRTKVRERNILLPK